MVRVAARTAPSFSRGVCSSLVIFVRLLVGHSLMPRFF